MYFYGIVKFPFISSATIVSTSEKFLLMKWLLTVLAQKRDDFCVVVFFCIMTSQMFFFGYFFPARFRERNDIDIV
jgi:hypothetical protein